MAIWIDANALVDAFERSSIWGWSTEQDQTAHKWVFDVIEGFLNDTQPSADGDLISRRDAIEAVVCHIWHMPNEAYRQFNCENIAREVVEDAIQRLPSAEQATCKLKNPCDSLLTDDSGVRKEQKSKLDLIDRVERIESWEFFYKVSQIKIPKEKK